MNPYLKVCFRPILQRNIKFKFSENTYRLSEISNDCSKGRRNTSTTTFVNNLSSLNSVPNLRGLSTSVRRLIQLNHINNDLQGNIKSASISDGDLKIQFSDNTECMYPASWLRDNCQCDACYDHQSHTRKLVLDQWSTQDSLSKLTFTSTEVEVGWSKGISEGHISKYNVNWLKERSFSSADRKVRRNMLALDKVHWNKTYTISEYPYNSLLNDDEQLLAFLVDLETYGLALIKDTPREPKACMNIVNRAGFAKRTHYGIHYPIQSKASANSLAYTDSRLETHNDLPYYDQIPGIIFLHCIQQIEGTGGVNQLTDGYRVAEMLKEKHPEAFHLLTTRPVYFWNKGIAQVADETTEFLMLTNIPVIMLDNNGVVKRVNKSQLRDSYLDLPVDEVAPWYDALRLFNSTVHEEALIKKLSTGDTLVMDNTRLMHGRTAYDGNQGERYMDQIYLDWDQALSRRRVLTLKYGLPQN